MADVTFVLNAQEAQAVGAFLKVVDAQKKVTRAARETGDALGRSGRSAKGAGDSFGALSGTLTKMVGGLVGGYSVKWALGQVAQSFQESVRITQDFNREMTGLLSLGDNARNFASVKQEVLDMSNAMGIARGEVAGMMFNLQSGASGLDVDVIRQLRMETVELAKATGTDLETSMTALLKTFRIYGDEVDSINDLQNKLFQTAERGYMTFGDLGTLLPNVANAAKGFGYELDEVLGMLTVATQVGGDNETTFTGVRNIFLRMNQALEEGIPLTNDLVTNLQILADQDPDVVNKIFGDRTFATVQGLADNTARLRKEIEKAGTASGDLAQSALWDKMKDASYRLSEMVGAFNKAAENALIMGGPTAEKYEESVTNMSAAKAGYSQNPLTRPFAGLLSYGEEAGRQAAGFGQRLLGGWAGKGLNTATFGLSGAVGRGLDVMEAAGPVGGGALVGKRAQIESMRAAGRDKEADYYEIQWGLRTGSGLPERGYYLPGERPTQGKKDRAQSANEYRMWQQAGTKAEGQISGAVGKGWGMVAGAMGLPEELGGSKAIRAKQAPPESAAERERREERESDLKRRRDEAVASYQQSTFRTRRDFGEREADEAERLQERKQSINERYQNTVRSSRGRGGGVNLAAEQREARREVEKIESDAQKESERRLRDANEKLADEAERFRKTMDSINREMEKLGKSTGTVNKARDDNARMQ